MMMRRLLIIISALFFCILLAEAQTGTTAERSASERSQEKAKAQLQLRGARQLQEIDPSQAIKMVEEVIRESDRSAWQALLYESATLLAALHFAEEQYRRAARAAGQALEAAKALQDDQKALASLGVLKNIYTADGRSRKLSAVTEQYATLKTALDLEARNEQFSKLEDTYVATASEMETIAERLDKTEIARRLLQEEKLRLENTTLNLRNDSIKSALELEKEENKVMALSARTKRQQNLLLTGGLITIFIIILAFVWIWIVREKRKQEAQQALLKQQLLQKDKMAVLGEMTAGIAHEIKNPLNFVNNFAEGSIDLLEELQESLQGQLPKMSPEEKQDLSFLLEELRQNAEDIHKQGRRADDIINGMMNHARGESSESSLVDINTLLLDSWELAYAGAGARYTNIKVEFQKELAENLPAIRVIPQDLNRAFLNIFINSLEAFAERGIARPAIVVQTTTENEVLQISIRDNAGGVSTAIQEKVFNPFFTTKPTGKGNTGLGLSIAHDIIEKGHDGSIELQSDAQQFTEIQIRLPLMTR